MAKQLTSGSMYFVIARNEAISVIIESTIERKIRSLKGKIVLRWIRDCFVPRSDVPSAILPTSIRLY
jgi:hypothetical protein